MIETFDPCLKVVWGGCERYQGRIRREGFNSAEEQRAGPLESCDAIAGIKWDVWTKVDFV